MSDIKIKDGNNKFKYRVCGLIRNQGKVLIQKIQDNSFYCLPGGHVELGESSLQAIQREMKEEVGKQTENEKLFAVVENFFTGSKGEIFHELGFYYVVDLAEYIEMKDYTVVENDKGELKKLEYRWVNPEELEEIDFRPEFLKKLVSNKNLGDQVEHVINVD